MRLTNRLFLLGCLAPLMLSAPAAQAQVSDREVLVCHEQKDDAARLACYDEIGARVTAVREAEKTGGKWRVTSRDSKFSDTPDVYVTLPADDTVNDLLAGEVRPVLWLACTDGKMTGYINFGFTIGGGKKQIEYRIDGSAPQTASLETSSDFQALGNFKNPDQLTETLKLWFGSREFVIRTVSISNEPMVATFDLTGIEEAVEPLRQSCGW